MNVFTNPGWGYDLAVILFYMRWRVQSQSLRWFLHFQLCHRYKVSLPYNFFPFKGHISLPVCAKFHLALEAPSQGRRDRGEKGHVPQWHCFSWCWEAPGRMQQLPAEAASLPDRACTAFHFSQGVFQELSKLNTFSGGCSIPTSSHLLPFCLRPADAHDVHLFWKWDRGQEGHFGKEELWSLFFNLLLSEQPISVLLALCKSSLKSPQQKMQGPVSAGLHPAAMEAVQTLSCCWSCCRQELPFGTTDPVLALASAGVAVPGSSCPPAQSPPAAPHCGFWGPGLQASGPHSKLAERDTTTGSRHIIQGPCFQKYSKCFRSLWVFQPWKLPLLILCCKSTN